jgi:hypothetical protein
MEQLEPQKCAKCKEPLSGFVTGKNPSPDGLVCDDCHYEAIGEELDQFPIGSPRTNR